MSDIKAIRNNGTDVFMVVDGKSLDQYADEKDYSLMARVSLDQGLTLNPILIAGESWLVFQRLLYERRKNLRNWLEARAALIAMRKAGVDENSPEYQKLEKTHQAYLDMLAAIDKKLSNYENA
jgi:hypothetical protein